MSIFNFEENVFAFFFIFNKMIILVVRLLYFTPTFKNASSYLLLFIKKRKQKAFFKFNKMNT